MRKLIILLLLTIILSSCTTHDESKRLDVIIKNNTSIPIEFKASVGSFGNKIILKPGDSWYGWILPSLIKGKISIEANDSK